MLYLRLTSAESSAKQHLLISPVLYLSIDSSVHITFWSGGSCRSVCHSSSLSLCQCCSHAIMQRLLLILQVQPQIATIVSSHRIQILLVMSKAPQSFGCACLGFSERCFLLLKNSQVSTKQHHPIETLVFQSRFCMTGYCPQSLESQKPEDGSCAKAIAHLHTKCVIHLMVDLMAINLLPGCSAVIKPDMRCTQLQLLTLSKELCSHC